MLPLKEQFIEMNFDELLIKTIELLEHYNYDDKNTYEKSELLDLCELLNERIEIEFDMADVSPRGLSKNIQEFTPSEELKILMDKRELHKKENQIGYESEEVFSQIKLLRTKEWNQHLEHFVAGLDESKAAYLDKKKELQLEEEKKKKERQHKVKEIRIKIHNCCTPKNSINVRKLNWKIMPSGTCGIKEITSHFKLLEKSNKDLSIDFDRLEKIKQLKPTTCYVGIDEFVGYIVFCFDYTDKVIFENPIKGNAIYLIKGDWSQMTHLTKNEMLKCHRDRVNKIIHKGEWFKRLKNKLSNRG